nr:hypothetical protein [Tanacetum cinerariifolium]
MPNKKVLDAWHGARHVCLFCNTETSSDVCAECLVQIYYCTTQLESKDSAYLNQTSVRRCADLWQNLKARVLLQNEHTDVVEHNGWDRVRSAKSLGKDVLLDFQDSVVHFTSPKRDLQNALMESKSFRDDVYGSLFQQTGSVETRASVENGSLYVSTNARGHAFSTASQRETSAREIASFNNGKRRREFHQILPTSTRYPRTSKRNVRSRSERTVTNELAASSTALVENIQRIDHGLPQSTYTLDANESPPYKDLGDCNQCCPHCGALFWYEEWLQGTAYNGKVEYHL